MGDEMEVEGPASEQQKQQDVQQKTYEAIRSSFPLLERAVAQFDSRFTLRALRSISTLRKKLTAPILLKTIIMTYGAGDNASPTRGVFMRALGQDPDAVDSIVRKMMTSAEQKELMKNNTKEHIPEIDMYLAVLIQVLLHLLHLSVELILPGLPV